MKIEKEAVEAAVKLIVAYMEQEQKFYKEHWKNREDGPHHEFVASICHDILDASGRDDWGGCPLCRS